MIYVKLVEQTPHLHICTHAYSTVTLSLTLVQQVCLKCQQMGDYSVSLKAPGRNKHFRVHVEGALYCIGQRKFHTLDQLVDHYQRAPIYTNKQGEKLYLVRPLPRANNGC